MIFLLLSMVVTPLVARAAGKTYTNTTKGFTITLPSGWIKLQPDSSDTLFGAATSNQAAQWALLAMALKNQQSATDRQQRITKKTAKYAEAIRVELNKEFENSCTTVSAQKKTLGSNTGAMLVYGCTSDGMKISTQLFTFVRKIKQYSAVGVTAAADYATYKAGMESITKSLVFSK